MTPPNNPPNAPGQGEGDENAGTAKKGFWKRLTDKLSKDNVDGDANVSAGAIIITALFLMLLTAGLLYSIVITWPRCDPTEEIANNNAASNTNGNANGNTNANANTAANLNNNVNAGIRVQANTNTSGNVGAGTPTPTPTPGATPTPTPGTPTPLGVTPRPTPTETGGTTTPTKIIAKSIEPKSGPTIGDTLVTIKGKNFGPSAEGLTVKFDGSAAKIDKVSDESITARTPHHSEGIVDVRVERDENNYDVLDYTYTCPAPTGARLFYLIIFAGALGGCIYAMRSFFWYVGQRELKWSWLPRYYSLPFIGAAMALLFGLLIFAGLFVDNKAGRSTALFMIAVAGLVGMFSQQAALKLTDIANAIFTKPEKGKDAAPQKSLPPDADDKEEPIGSP